jgi:hypothetical protein
MNLSREGRENFDFSIESPPSGNYCSVSLDKNDFKRNG